MVFKLIFNDIFFYDCIQTLGKKQINRQQQKKPASFLAWMSHNRCVVFSQDWKHSFSSRIIRYYNLLPHFYLRRWSANGQNNRKNIIKYSIMERFGFEFENYPFNLACIECLSGSPSIFLWYVINYEGIPISAGFEFEFGYFQT